MATAALSSAETWFQAPGLTSALSLSPLLWLKAGNDIPPSFPGACEGQISQRIQKYLKGEVLYKQAVDCARSWGRTLGSGWGVGQEVQSREVKEALPGLGTEGEGEGKEVAGPRTGDSKLRYIETQTQTPQS